MARKPPKKDEHDFGGPLADDEAQDLSESVAEKIKHPVEAVKSFFSKDKHSSGMNSNAKITEHSKFDKFKKGK